MADSVSRNLQLWERWAPARTSEAAARGRGPAEAVGGAARLFAAESLLPPARAAREPAEPFTLQWFLDAENARYARAGRWLPKLLEFAKHSGETVLGLGDGLGTDWAQYARHGAAVTACCPAADQLALVQRHFELRGLRGEFLHADAAALPLESASVDVACVRGLLHAAPDPAAVVAEVYRVLKPGGKVLAVVPARYDSAYWVDFFAPWKRWLGRRPAPARTGFGRRSLRRLFARFSEPRVHKRGLRRSDILHLWRWMPLPLLERLIGRFLVLKAFKPLSAALPAPLAA
jgi:SAM-dependent methyltransferase